MQGITRVEEMQGVYGPFTLAERVIQRIWLNQDFVRENLRCVSGKALRVLNPGRWNLQGGPDFTDAQLQIGDETLVGDVEIHFRSGDWNSHGHQHNSAFNRVRLHVVLFPDGPQQEPVRTQAGTTFETLVLLPRLLHDLETYAADEALGANSGVDLMAVAEPWLQQPLEARLAALQQRARKRWLQKTTFVGTRLDREKTETVAHTLFLEALGYRRNRPAFHRLALQYPLAQWHEPDFDLDAAYAMIRPYCQLSGLRPANHPRRRMEQYQRLVQAHPDWPERTQRWLRQRVAGLPAFADETSTRAYRKQYALSTFYETWRSELLADCFGGTRANTLLADVVLPWGAVVTETDNACYALWFHGYCGDLPERLKALLHLIGLSEWPACNGYSQGALQLLLE